MAQAWLDAPLRCADNGATGGGAIGATSSRSALGSDSFAARFAASSTAIGTAIAHNRWGSRVTIINVRGAINHHVLAILLFALLTTRNLSYPQSKLQHKL
jgi:hypothetical protein